MNTPAGPKMEQQPKVAYTHIPRLWYN
jgi:hypothetical protein